MAGFASVVVRPEVVRAVAKGNRDAQESIYRDFSKPVYTMAFQILQNMQLAEDVTHDTFVAVFTKSPKLRDPTSFSGWIRRIAVNHCLMVLRSSSHKHAVPWDEQTLAEDSTVVDHERTIDLERALQVLPPATRLVVWLYVVEGYTHAEIGNLFEKSQSFSKSQLSRALSKLRHSISSPHLSIDQIFRSTTAVRSCEAR
ncbi:MAG: sigma-70 family RNA polymerase sigma factor [Gammaproteobacteria bacterium]|nr:sigma-70 family RNA polymerase sigma factor [Gammaproteobacteria bacterium]